MQIFFEADGFIKLLFVIYIIFFTVSGLRAWFTTDPRHPYTKHFMSAICWPVHLFKRSWLETINISDERNIIYHHSLHLHSALQMLSIIIKDLIFFIFHDPNETVKDDSGWAYTIHNALSVCWPYLLYHGKFIF